jgi:hypothetical protein
MEPYLLEYLPADLGCPSCTNGIPYVSEWLAFALWYGLCMYFVHDRCLMCPLLLLFVCIPNYLHASIF